MKQRIRDVLFNRYSELEYNPKNVLTYCFVYNKVNVRVHFDLQDKYNPEFFIVLSYEEIICCKQVSVTNKLERYGGFKFTKENYKLYKRLQDETGFQSFFDAIDKHILEDKGLVTMYENDMEFQRATRYLKDDELPFISHLVYLSSPRRMSDAMFDKLRDELGIDEKILMRIKAKGFTVARTGDYNKKKMLVDILEDKHISYILYKG